MAWPAGAALLAVRPVRQTRRSRLLQPLDTHIARPRSEPGMSPRRYFGPGVRPIDLLNGWRRTRDGVSRPACPACGRRVVDSGHAVHLHGGVYHPDCALYRVPWSRDRGRLA